jgi:membrane fusion protein, multidrug efflux system
MMDAPWSPSVPPSRNAGRILYIGTGVFVVVVLGMVVGLSAFRKSSVARERRERVATVDAGPRVRAVGVERSPGSRTIVLTGEARPFLSVALYAKVSGYLKELRVDKGDHVMAGQVLAVVESPETDQSADAASADARNKRLIANRDAQLVDRKLIAPEEAEQAETDAKVAQSRAQGFEALQRYETLRAPFSGTVTARYADPGALVQNAENSQTSALPVVEVGQTDSLRVYVYLDQRDAADVRRGAPVVITDPNRPSLRVSGAVSRFTGELDPNTRTLLAEIDVSNRKGAIVPGSVVRVELAVAGQSYLEVPAEAMIDRGTKHFVAIINTDNRVNFREVHMLDTDGITVRLLDGVTEGERVAINLGDSVPEGQRVQPLGDSAAARGA